MAIADENITIESTEMVVLEAPRYYKNIFDILKNQTVR